MATLGKIVTQIADALNRPFDAMLKARLKDLVIQEFSLYASRSISKYGIDKEFVYTYIVTELETISSISGTALVRPYMRTINKIPRPLRYNSDCPFIYVGTTEGDIVFSFRNFFNRRYTNLLPNVGNAPSYDFVEDRLLLWNTPVTIITPANPDAEPPVEAVTAPLDHIMIKQVPFDPRTASTPDSLDDDRFDSDKEFPVTQDFVNQIITALLSGQLRVTDSKDVVEATHKDNE